MASATTNEIDHCEVCGSRTLVPVLDLGAHPMCDDLVAIGSSRICAEYPIEILYCEACRTAHQRFQVPKRELFPETYHYRSRLTADVLSGMKSLVDSCEQRFGSLGPGAFQLVNQPPRMCRSSGQFGVHLCQQGRALGDEAAEHRIHEACDALLAEKAGGIHGRIGVGLRRVA